MTEGRLERFLRRAVLVCLFLPVALLTSMALFSVCHITHLRTEVHYYVPAQGLLLVPLFLLFLGALMLGRRRLAPWLGRHAKAVTLGLLLALSALGVLFVLTARVQPGADQAKVILAAAHWRSGNFSDLQRGGYLYLYPHQIGLVLATWLASFLFGSGSYLPGQLCNVAALAGAIWFLGRAAALLFPHRWTQPAVTAALCLFLPLFFYTAFNYGTLYGLCCSAAAFYLLLRFLAQRRAGQLCGMALLAAAAVLLKQNYLISLMAMALVLLFDLLRSRRLSSLLAAGVLVGAALLCSAGAQAAVGAISGQPVSDGIPKSAWVMMGLQDSDRGPGWYNDSTVKLYTAADFDGAKTDRAARSAIVKQLRAFTADPAGALRFFAQKIASQWNEPTFQCFWISSVRQSFDTSPAFIQSLLAGRLALALEKLMRVFCLFVLLGTLCLICFPRHRVPAGALYLALAFVGGFLFHLAWEAKAEYALPYFALLIPCAAEGCAGAAARLQDFLGGVSAAKSKKAALRRGWKPLLALCLLAALLVHPGFVRNTLDLGCDRQAYAQCLSQRAEGMSSARSGR